MNNQKKHLRGTSKRFAALYALICIALISGCAKKTEGTIYLSGISRLKIMVDSDAQTKDLSPLNKGAKALTEDIDWKGKKEIETLDTIIQKMQKEETPYLYIDVLSEDKSWEAEEIKKLTDYFSDTVYKSEIPIEVRKVTDLDKMDSLETFNSGGYRESNDATSPESTESTSMSEAETSSAEPSSEISPTEETTSDEPATAESSVAAPTTVAPTTAARATSEPTTAAPTTAPTTAAPTTAAPTTAAPTTAAPTTVEATAAAPGTPSAGTRQSETPESEMEQTSQEGTTASESTQAGTEASSQEPETSNHDGSGNEEILYGPGW